MLEILTQRPGLRFRHAFRIALAVVIAYYLALSWGWTSPHWAALTISTISMVPDLSESLAKGRNRILGTLLAVCFSLLLLGLFYQDRWPFFLCMALWLAFCAYRIGGSTNGYFWLVAGFVAPIIALRAGPSDAASAFLAAVERAQENLLGICVYTLVVLFVWPEKREQKATEAGAPQQSTFFPDPDRFVGAVYVFTTFMLGSFLVVYVPSFPNGGYVLALLPSVSLAIASMPFIPLRILYRPIVNNILIGAAISILVLPHLTNFAQLAALMFAMSFSISYRFFDPAMAIGRSLGMSFVFVLLHVSNEQSHSFLYTANLAAMLLVSILILLVMDHFPRSRLPEKRLAWQLRRFERSACFLAAHRARPRGLLVRYRHAFHQYEVATLPQKLPVWRQYIPAELLHGNVEQLDRLLTDVKAMSERLLQEDDVEDSLRMLSDDCHALCVGAFARPRFS